MKTALLLLGLLGVALAVVIRHPLKKIQTARVRKMLDGTWAEYYKERQQRVGNHGGQPQNDYQDVSYVGEVDIGTPTQKFYLIMDTGSSNLWVVDSTCGQHPASCVNASGCQSTSSYCSQFCNNPACCGSSLSCSGKHMFSSSASSTYRPNGTTWSIQYGTGAASGFMGNDKVCVAGLCVNMGFGQATDLASFFAGQPLDGICGLAWPRISVDHAPTLMQTMIAQKVLDMPVVTVWMTSLHMQTGNATGGLMTFGGYDTTDCAINAQASNVNWVPLTSQTYWQYKVTSVSAGSTTGSGGNAISDTGTSLLLGPQATMSKIATYLGGKFDNTQGVYMIACTATPGPITVVINGQSYPVKYQDYIVPLGNGQCFLGIDSFNGGSIAYILGDTFIRNYCHIFDVGNARIGLAAATK